MRYCLSLSPTLTRIAWFEFLLTSPQGNGAIASIPKFEAWQQQTSAFQDVAAYDLGGPGFNLTGDRPEQVHGIHVTQGYFRLFGATPMLGRTFTPQEDSPNGGKVVVLSYGLWQRKFGGNPNVVGTALSLGNEPYTIVGVLGKSFVSDPEADILLPFQFDPNSTNQGHYFRGRRATQARRDAGPGQRPDEGGRRSVSPPLPGRDWTEGRICCGAAARLHRWRRAQVVAGDAGRGEPGAADCLRQRRQSAPGARHRPQA